MKTRVNNKWMDYNKKNPFHTLRGIAKASKRNKEVYIIQRRKQKTLLRQPEMHRYDLA